VEVTARFMFMSWILFFIKPSIEVDGAAYRRKWGTYFFDLAPGRHRVEVSFPYLFGRKTGANSVEFDLSPGQTRRIRYRAPLILLMKGRIAEV
jgi:hypothetical protein